ncbi:MAG: hypothetical protein AAF604_15800 [Acidobacteriota bacterium]
MPELSQPERSCDLVMKGGITSGVVYPHAVLEIAKNFRLANVGGTSAGAIAAGLSAAAEYGRDQGGFKKLGRLSDFLKDHLLDLFQPHPRHRKAFKRLLALMDKQKRRKARGRDLVEGLGDVVKLVPTAWRVVQSYRCLDTTYYGLCPGTTQAGRVPALTDWLTEMVEQIAGRMDGDELPATPLTFGDLEKKGILLRTLTTDLGGKRPVVLPLIDESWMFREDEFRALFPGHIVDWMVEKGEADEKAKGFFKLPRSQDLPVLFGMRLSLSFPFLLAAIPLYRRDFSLRLDKDEQWKPRCCWMSDGGLSSNFPIHLFDSPMPQRPTFGISLTEFSPHRHDRDPTSVSGRVFLPKDDNPNAGRLRPIGTVGSPIGFLGAMFDTARNWQDSLQTVLPGYRERIVQIALTKEEGGLNLDMDPDVVARLLKYGQRAGQELSGFNLQEHQWRRFLASYGAFEAAFEGMAETYDEFRSAVASHKPLGYEALLPGREELLGRLDSLMAVAKAWAKEPRRNNVANGRGVPKPRARLKFAPKDQGASAD